MSSEPDKGIYSGVSATSSKTVTTTTDYKPRCPTCGGLLAIVVTRPWEIDCRRCSQGYKSPPPGVPMPVPPPSDERAMRASQSRKATRIPPPPSMSG